MTRKKVRVCIVCSKEFYGKNPGRRGNLVCSEECRRKRITDSKLKGQNIKCEVCQNEFWVKPSRLKRGVKYCSSDCHEKARKEKRVNKVCKYCNSEYIVTSAHKYSAYCSKECHNKGQLNRVIVPCAICEKDVERIPSELKKNKNGIALCSKECVKEYFLTRVIFFQTHTNTKPERMFNEATPDYINQTSDGKFYINFKNGKVKNPDFIVRPVNKTKKVIEIFGRYWHPAEEEPELINLYKEVGYDCLIIWEEEVYNDTYHEKLQTFLSNVPT